MKIRRCGKEDLNEVRGLLEGEGLPVDDISDHVESIYVAEDAGGLLGLGGYELYEGMALFRSLVVRKEYRGRGIGARLLAGIEEILNDMGVREIYLITTDAGPYFEKKGFSAIQRDHVPEQIKNTRQFSSLCPSSAIVMRKQINGGRALFYCRGDK